MWLHLYTNVGRTTHYILNKIKSVVAHWLFFFPDGNQWNKEGVDCKGKLCEFNFLIYIFYVFVVWLFVCFETWSHIIHSCLKFSKYLRMPLNFWSSSLPPEGGDNRHALLFPFYAVLGTEPRALNMLRQLSFNWTISLALLFIILIMFISSLFKIMPQRILWTAWPQDGKIKHLRKELNHK